MSASERPAGLEAAPALASEAPSPAKQGLFGRALPWVVSLAVCAVLLWPFRDEAGRAALADAVRHASGWTLPVVLLFAVTNWLTDAWATGMTFRHFGTNISLKDALFVRGATLVFDAVNPSLGQVALGVVMYRRGTPLAKTVQTLLLLNVVFVLEMVCIAGVGLALGSYPTEELTFQVVFVSLAIAAVYVALIAIKPAALARQKSIANLFDAGVRGHAMAFLVRLPSMAVILGTMFALQRCFGIHAPLSEALVYLVAVLFITGLPISVQGIGPAQLAQVAFFASYVHADTRAAQAVVIAWGLTCSIGMALGSFVVGVGCLFTKVGRAAFVAGRTARSTELSELETSPPR